MSEVFAKRLRHIRKGSGKTQVDMAEIFKLSSVAYGAWERNETEPNINNLVRLCEIFKVSADWLIGHDSAKPEQDQKYDTQIKELERLAGQATVAIAQCSSLINDMKKS